MLAEQLISVFYFAVAPIFVWWADRDIPKIGTWYASSLLGYLSSMVLAGLLIYRGMLTGIGQIS
jgi:hypothetical protein